MKQNNPHPDHHLKSSTKELLQGIVFLPSDLWDNKKNWEEKKQKKNKNKSIIIDKGNMGTKTQ